MRGWLLLMACAVLVVFSIILMGCAGIERRNYWYEYPGIAFGGATVGALVGPEVVSVAEARTRYKAAHNYAWCNDDCGFAYGAAWVLHAGSATALFVMAPPFGWAYLGLSSLVGGAQFAVHGAWDQ